MEFTASADGTKSCGSAPTGIITSTRARSPATLRAMSPMMEVVAKITISGASVDGTVSSLAGPPPQAAPARTVAKTAAQIRLPNLILLLLPGFFANVGLVFL